MSKRWSIRWAFFVVAVLSLQACKSDAENLQELRTQHSVQSLIVDSYVREADSLRTVLRRLPSEAASNGDDLIRRRATSARLSAIMDTISIRSARVDVIQRDIDRLLR